MLSLCPPVTSMLTHIFRANGCMSADCVGAEQIYEKIVTVPNSETLIKSPNVSARVSLSWIHFYHFLCRFRPLLCSELLTHEDSR